LYTDSTIGARLKAAREERDYSQRTLAERAGVSLDLVRKLEQGVRGTARITSLTRLAGALDVDLSRLLGRRERIDRGHDPSVLAVRDALQDVTLLPGVDPRDDDGKPAPVADLSASLERAWDCYWDGRLGELAAMIPGLIGEARITVRALGSPAAGHLAQSCQLAAKLLVHTGADDLAFTAARLAMEAAEAGDDELQAATVAGAAAWALMHQGRNAEAGHVARCAAARIEPSIGEASATHLTVWGSLLLWAAAAAAGHDDAGTVDDCIATAREAAYATRGGKLLFSADRHDYKTNFGRTQVEMQACYTASVLGRDGAAITAAGRVRRSDLLPISWGAHRLDVAQVMLHGGGQRVTQAVAALAQAHSVSREWFRHQALARRLVVQAVDTEKRRSGLLRALAESVGVPY
jgi:transcriptional regulator with XRE-family HTH domain